MIKYQLWMIFHGNNSAGMPLSYLVPLFNFLNFPLLLLFNFRLVCPNHAYFRSKIIRSVSFEVGLNIKIKWLCFTIFCKQCKLLITHTHEIYIKSFEVGLNIKIKWLCFTIFCKQCILLITHTHEIYIKGMYNV